MAVVNYRAAAAAAARKFGIDPIRFQRQIGAESNFNPGAHSGAGAVGIAQIMPGTARGWGVNPNDPLASLDAAARADAGYLRSYGGDWRRTLAAYNAGPGAVKKYGGVPPFAETQNYIKKILGAGGDSIGNVVNAGPGGSNLGGTVPNTDFRSVLAAASAGRQEGQSLTGAVRNALFASSLGAARAPQDLGTHQESPNLPAAAGRALGGRAGSLIGRQSDRAGVATQPAILDFARQISGTLGSPIQLGTGTAHNRMTTSGNVSAHWGGNALDLPASGSRLIQEGQAALISAGMNPAQARRVKGGLFNIGGYQVIFNTGIGGNHFNHVHVGIRK